MERREHPSPMSEYQNGGRSPRPRGYHESASSGDNTDSPGDLQHGLECGRDSVGYLRRDQQAWRFVMDQSQQVRQSLAHPFVALSGGFIEKPLQVC